MSEITDTERLEFLMKFFTVDDIGDEHVFPGVVVDADEVSDAFSYAVEGEVVTMLYGWQNPDMRRVIDKAIKHDKGGEM